MKTRYISSVLLPLLLLSVLYISRSCTSAVEGEGSFPYLELAPGTTKTIYVGSNDTTVTVNLISNRELEAVSNKSWVTTVMDYNRLRLIIKSNDTLQQRHATVTIRDENRACEQQLRVIQDSMSLY